MIKNIFIIIFLVFILSVCAFGEDNVKIIILHTKVYSVYPFDNIILTMDMKGSDLENVFQTCIEGKHSILQVSSGLKVKYDLSGLQKKVKIMINNKPLDHNAVYKVATVDFLALGGDGYEGFKAGKNISKLMLVRDALVTYLSLKSPVNSKVEGRIEFIK